MGDSKNSVMIKKYIPVGIKRTLLQFFQKSGFVKLIVENEHLREEMKSEVLKEIGDWRERQENLVPQVELEDKHIANLKILLNRDAFLKHMPKGGVCAEIGVDRGEFSEQILQILMPQKLYLIDAWGDPNRYTDALKDLVRQKFKAEIQSGLIELKIGFSTEVLKTWPDQSLDWVYVDTDHTYQTTRAELNLLQSKMKTNGIIAGHDYSVGNWTSNFRYGVIEAVHEFCRNENWEIIFLTSETNQFRNFAIRKIL
jgi:hypothetical protein